jgi:hypothetical protein
MKRISSLVLIGIFCFTLVGCANESKNDSVNIGEESKYVLRDDLVSMSVNEESVTNYKATFILINHTDETYDYGEPYSIEYEKDGIWYEIIPINDMNFNMIAYILEPKGSKEITVDWEYHYGKLIPGKYRIIKDVFRELDIPIEPSDKVYIGVEFIIK